MWCTTPEASYVAPKCTAALFSSHARWAPHRGAICLRSRHRTRAPAMADRMDVEFEEDNKELYAVIPSSTTKVCVLREAKSGWGRNGSRMRITKETSWSGTHHGA